MARNGKDPVLVVVQLAGGNDFMNTVIPYTSGIYHDSRPKVGVPQDQVLPINDTLGFHPNMGPFKELYDEGKVAIVQGIGYPNSDRSHFRAMDIWYTCEPTKLSEEGWLGKVTQELDPKKENVLTTVNVGMVMPRALALTGVPVTSLANLDNYGIMTSIARQDERQRAMDLFKRMYTPGIGSGPVKDFLAQTGQDVLKGADDLKKAALTEYKPKVEYGNNMIGRSLRDIARIHLAGLGTRVFYTLHANYDTHANENPAHPNLIKDLSGAVNDFFTDLRDNDASEEVVMLIWTEFGRRVKDNGSGTDHGTGGGAYIVGDRVKGGLYAEYPPLDPARWEHGEDLAHTIDYRGIYGTVVEQWLGLDPVPIVNGNFEQIKPFA